jgi:hypothetical protein
MEIIEKPAEYYTFETGEYFSFQKRYTIDTHGNIRGRCNKILKPRDIIFDIQLTDDDGKITTQYVSNNEYNQLKRTSP